MLVLYGSKGSGSAAVEAALACCGLPYEVRRASTWEADSAHVELLALNPLGQIPTLKLEDGSVLSESAAILIHLGLAHPRSCLLPQDAAARAQVLRALVFIAANCYAAIGVIDYPERWITASAPTRAKLRDGARSRLHLYWELFADQFATGPSACLAGPAPNAAAILAAVVSRWSGARAHLKQHRPELLALVQAVERHPVTAPVFARHWPA